MSVRFSEGTSVRLDRFATLYLGKDDVSLKTDLGETPEYLFISHAHFDHLSRSDVLRTRAICSEETFLLSTLRGFEVKLAESNPFDLLDSGHILGSKALLVDTGTDRILYTGDVNVSPVEGIRKQRFPKARVLIIESNYGRPELLFPPREELVGEIVDYVNEMIKKDRPIVLMGYPLGKSQHLQKILDPALQGIETYVTPSIANYNNVYRLFSVRIEEKKVFLAKSSELPDGCWALYYSNTSGRDAFLQYLRRKYNATLISFSGMALFRWYREKMGMDKAFPLSDHADFNGLMEIVSETSPEKVFTIHGFSEEFSKELRRFGYDSRPIRPDVRISLKL